MEKYFWFHIYVRTKIGYYTVGPHCKTTCKMLISKHTNNTYEYPITSANYH